MEVESEKATESGENGGITGKDTGDGKQAPVRMTFKEKLLGRAENKEEWRKVDMLKTKLVQIEHEDNNRLLPKCIINDAMFTELCKPWGGTLIAKLLGKTLGFLVMREKLRQLWKPKGGMDVLDIGHGYFMVSFDEHADKVKAMGEGPWMIFDHSLSVREWDPDFVSSEAKVDKTLVWIRFPCLGLAYYE